MLIEAFACGVPVVASVSGEIPYVVGDAGLVVPEGDAQRWREAIGGLLVDESARRRLAERGRRRAVAEYDWTSVADRHAAFFEELVSGGARRGGIRMNPALSVAICADFAEERWPSMDRVAAQLLAAICAPSRASTRTPVRAAVQNAARCAGRPAGAAFNARSRAATGSWTTRGISARRRRASTSFTSSITATPTSCTGTAGRPHGGDLPRPRRVPLDSASRRRGAAVGAVPGR